MANNRVPASKRALILAAMCEGMAINSICRMFKTGKHTVLRVIQETGEACEDWHNTHFRDLTIARLELDEQWAYVHTHKERMTLEQKQANPDRGDCWLWAALDADTKAIVSWRTGKRTSDAASTFAHDLAERVSGRVQITSDKLRAYNYSLPGAFGSRMDYAQEEKKFLMTPMSPHDAIKCRVSPLVGVDREAVSGNPNLRTSTVCHVERFFLTMRQGNKRCARKTLAYSKLWDNHALTASIHIFVYNMVRKHEALKGQTPAQALGIVGERWTLERVVEMTEAYLNAKEEAEFEKAFADFNVRPLARRTFQPTPKAELLTPWYLDPQSGGPNPPTEERKPGIRYDD